MRKAASAFGVSLASAADVVEQMHEIGLAYRAQHSELLIGQDGERAEAHRQTTGIFVFETDEGHAFNQWADVAVVREWLYDILEQRAQGEQNIPPLVREATLMVAEDNPLHQLFFARVDDVGNLTRFTPPAGMKAEGERQKYQEESGYYLSGERALEVIEGSEKPPDLLIADIELAGSMNGIQLIREIHRRWPDTVICMVYSSNINMYQEQVEALQTEGLVVGSWHKDDFSLAKMITTVNQELSRRESS